MRDFKEGQHLSMSIVARHKIGDLHMNSRRLTNGSGSKPASTAVTPLKSTEELPAQPETPDPPASAVPIASEHSATPVAEQESTPSHTSPSPSVQVRGE